MKRFVSTVISIPLVIIFLNLYPPYGSAFLFIFVGLLGQIENYKINIRHHYSLINYLVVFFLISIGMLSGHLLNIRSMELDIPWIYLVLGLTWGNDGAAMIIGKLLGKIKLAPNISPNKTVEGALAGVISASVIFAVFMYTFDQQRSVRETVANLMTGSVLAILAIVGDLYISSCKRASGVKDSGIFIPGQGGVLDKIDAMSVLLMCVYTIIWWI